MTTAGLSWRVRVVDVHLDTALAITHGGPFAARRRQADALIAALTPTAPRRDRDAERTLSGSPPEGRSGPAHTATIVAGDFNTWGGRERALDTLKLAFPDAPDSGAQPTWVGPLGVRATLDHVFASGRVMALEVRRLPDRFGSDHYPLLAMVRF
jgi:endonuclease/exonuclease/phosphatase family metal-dependent hydrolase